MLTIISIVGLIIGFSTLLFVLHRREQHRKLLLFNEKINDIKRSTKLRSEKIESIKIPTWSYTSKTTKIYTIKPKKITPSPNIQKSSGPSSLPSKDL